VREKGPRFTRCDIFKNNRQFFLTVLFRQTVGFLGASVLFDGERAKPVDGLKETRFVFCFLSPCGIAARQLSHMSAFF